jgi:transmembrane sensor
MTAPRSLADQAADWLVRRDRGLTPAEQDEFLQWLAADPRHGDALAREQQTWRELDLLADWRPEHAAEPNPDLLARPVAIRRAAPRPWLVPVGLAAAAVLAVIGYVAFRADPVRSPAPVAASGYEQRVLEDGSIAELNRGAAISATFTAGERRVILAQGEAHFTVKQEPARPFVVLAGGVEARAVGTAFHVRLGAASVEVLVTEGRVQVASAYGSLPPVVGAGERITVPLASARPLPKVDRVSAEEIARTLAWQPRLLEFASTPLADVVAEFNRRNAVQLILEDPALGALPIVASFRSDNVEGFVRLLEVTAGVHATREGETIRLRPKKSP